jgi:predicted nucleic acid-binding protein
MKKAERSDLSERMKVRFPEFEAGWNKLVREVGPELVNFIQEKINGHRSLLTELAKFKFKFVVDNNFIFGQIKGAIEKNKEIEKSFIYKLLSSWSIQIFAPPKLQEELFDKINLHIAEQNHEKAFGYALMILSRIEIKDAQWVDAWKKANNLIGELDEDDVPYLALALEIESHAIMTFDDVFHRQGDIRVWKHGDADKVITNYNSGFISFVIIERAGVLIGKILAAIFRFIRDSIVDLLELMVAIASGTITVLSKIPWPIWVLIVEWGLPIGMRFRKQAWICSPT